MKRILDKKFRIKGEEKCLIANDVATHSLPITLNSPPVSDF